MEESAAIFPFQKICMDYYQLKGSHYIAQADRYSGCFSVAKVKSTSFSELEGILCDWFVWHGVPDSITTDGGPPCNGEDSKRFCNKWKIYHRLSCAGYPEINGRAEMDAKTAKRLLENNADSKGSLNTDGVVKLCSSTRILLYAAAMRAWRTVFGRPVQDSLPMVPQEGWRRINDGREIGMARLKVDRKETYDMNKSDMEPLNNGDVVIIQNMTGPHPTKWMPTGTVIESTGHRQYRVKVDGSRRLLLRNRKNLKKINPIMESKRLKSRVIMPSQELLPQQPVQKMHQPVATMPTSLSPPTTLQPSPTQTAGETARSPQRKDHREDTMSPLQTPHREAPSGVARRVSFQESPVATSPQCADGEAEVPVQPVPSPRQDPG